MKSIHTPKAPEAIGPYCQAVVHNDLVFCSGQIGLDPETMMLVSDSDVEAQTRQIFLNLEHVLEKSGSSLGKILKTTVFLTSMDDFALMNKTYEKALGDHTPARSTIEVAALPKGAAVEIECIACIG